MPSTVSPPSRRRRAASTSESDGESDTSSSRGSKRLRGANGAAAGTPSPALDSVLPRTYLARSDSETVEGSVVDAPVSRSPREHQPGAIVRVKLTNFVTYKAAEIFPGPSLNMVIGPNGTGKSTLVCAICLGLGWEPRYLGRQKEAHEFIKHGESEAEIEVELRRAPGERRNTVVRCNLRRDGNKTSFAVNGRPASKKAAQDAARAYSIQIDNLCQFLPQDKVVEFAAMSPVDLLRSTQQAVAEPQMLAWHDQLIAHRQSQRALENTLATTAEHLANLETRQKVQERDVERVREREAVAKNIANWQKTKRVVDLRAVRTRIKAERRRYKECEQALIQLQNELGPALSAVTDKEKYLKDVQAAHADRSKVVEAAEQQYRDRKAALEKLGEEFAELSTKVEGKKKARRDAQVEKQRLQQVLQNLEKEKDSQPQPFDVAAFNDQIRTKERRQLELKQDEIPELKRQMDEIRDEAKRISEKKKQKDEELKGLDSQAGKQASKLQRLSRDSFEAWKYIQDHQHLFEKPVFAPPMISCSIKDQRYIPLIEALFSRNDFMTFTTQTNGDFEKLHKIIHEDLKLGEVNIRTTLVDLDRFKGMQPKDQQNWGFDGWALDYVEGPTPVLAMLCELSKLHITGVSLQDTTEEQYDALHSSNIGAWVTSKALYKIVRRREYGPGATSTSVINIKPPQVWTDQPVDLEARRQIGREKEELLEEFEKLREKGHEIAAEIKRFNEEAEELNSAIVELREEKDTKQKQQSAYRALPTKIETVETKLKAQDERLRQLADQSDGLLEEIQEIKLSRVQAVLEISQAVIHLASTREVLEEVEIMQIEAKSDLETLVERNQAVHAQLEEKRSEVTSAKEATQELERSYRREYAQLEEAQASYTEEEAAFLQAHIDTEPEEVAAELESEQARLVLMMQSEDGEDASSNARVIQEFESRQSRIEGLRTRASECETAIAEVRGVIANVRSRWEPRLDALVARISEAFAFNMAQIRCAGEVDMHKDEGDAGFEAWAVRIQVKFREAEPLTQLDAHRQSGGERAVATVFYLMSLQALTRSPFRVVDEINQGMDPRNERLVHGRMVAIATGNDEWEARRRHREQQEDDSSDVLGDRDSKVSAGSQYFLITPKLLHGLRYDEGMRVLCIASGEHMAGQGAADFGKAISVRRRMAATAIASG